MKATEIRNAEWRSLAKRCRFRHFDYTRDPAFPGNPMCRSGMTSYFRCMQRLCPETVESLRKEFEVGKR